VLPARRRDDVDLERHPGLQLHGRSGIDRRAHPLVETDLVARVQEDPEERVAEMAIDDRLERSTGLADVERRVPVCDRGEVRGDEPLDIVVDPWWQLGRVADHETGAAVQRPPDPECDGEPITAFDDAVARAEKSE